MTDHITPLHILIHKSFSALNEAPLFLQLAPSLIVPGLRAMPVRVRLGQPDSDNNITWIDAPIMLESNDAERSCIDFISAQQSLTGGGGGGDGSVGVFQSAARGNGDDLSLALATRKAAAASPALAALESSASALRVLQDRLTAISVFLSNCDSGRVVVGSPSAPRALLRAVAATISRLPLTPSEALVPALARESTDALLTGLLAGVACGAAGLQALNTRLAESSAHRTAAAARAGANARLSQARDISLAAQQVARTRGAGEDRDRRRVEGVGVAAAAGSGRANATMNVD